MDPIRNVLVPVDFSNESGSAARYAASLARRFGAELTIAHVLSEPPLSYSMIEPTPEKVESITDERRNLVRAHFERSLPGLQGAGIRHQVLEGDPGEEIARLANSRECDMVVMSTRGEGRIARLFTIGSVTTKVLHDVTRPVITAVQFEPRPSPLSLKRVLCAVDLGPHSTRILRWASDFAQQFSAELAVVHAATLGDVHELVIDGPIRETLSVRLHQKLSAVMQEAGVEGESFVEQESPPRAITAVARHLRADCIVLGRGVSHDLLGRLRANAYDIIRQAPCPVVSV